MGGYRFETVDACDGVIDRWEAQYLDDAAALDALAWQPIGSGLEVRLFRTADVGPFAVRESGREVEWTGN
ncbi:hypothetical protein ACWT_5869 [Actinoplanes sp. SE50]|nr:hypothetical protein ACPL_6000 [Actinoplanes sp. SE50/110]ATO85284.1 hypothetical protein ACWT_5869 [Actinoplanes sp. SE50]SLM02694.1 hypothetical protein ACSP50_5976 [Actinoplanes sp. SE50/110]